MFLFVLFVARCIVCSINSVFVAKKTHVYIILHNVFMSHHSFSTYLLLTLLSLHSSLVYFKICLYKL